MSFEVEGELRSPTPYVEGELRSPTPYMDWLDRWAVYTPDAVAIQDADSGRSYTYLALFEASSRVARYLRESRGIGPGDRVAVLSHNELEYVVLFFALIRLRAILVPIGFRLTAREISHVLQDCKPKLLVHQEQFQSVIEKLTVDYPTVLPDSQESRGSVMRFDGHPDCLTSVALDASRGLDSGVSTGAGDASTPCMILYTSGTTGAPKGAILTCGSLFWNSVSTGLRLNLNSRDVTLTFLPFFHTGGWNVLTTPLLHRGARVVLLKKFDADRVLELCSREKVSILFGVPTMLEMMRRSPAFGRTELSSIRYAIVGGEAMPLKLIRDWQDKGIPVRQGYGLTEFGPNVFSLGEEDAIRKIGSIGFPNFYIEARVVDGEGVELGDDQVGELILRGPACTPGYWNNPEATGQAIRGGWFHTGDLVRRDREGFYYVVGRKKDMFISGGENVYPAEVEQVLRGFPGIREAAVIGMRDEKWGEVGNAFIVPVDPSKPPEPEAITAFCQNSLARYKIPKRFTILAELPKGESGKVLKRVLAESQPAV